MPLEQHSGLWRRDSCELVLDGFFEDSFGLRSTKEDSIDKKSRRSADANPHAFLIILLNLSLEFLGRNTCIKLFCVQLELGRFGDQAVAVQASLVPKKEIVIFPEFSLLSGAS